MVPCAGRVQKRSLYGNGECIFSNMWHFAACTWLLKLVTSAYHSLKRTMEVVQVDACLLSEQSTALSSLRTQVSSPCDISKGNALWFRMKIQKEWQSPAFLSSGTSCTLSTSFATDFPVFTSTHTFTVFASSDFAVNSFYYFLSKAGLFSAKLSLTTNVSGNDIRIF